MKQGFKRKMNGLIAFFKNDCPNVAQGVNSCVKPLCDHLDAGRCAHPKRPGREAA